jgi:hypothetical protein
MLYTDSNRGTIQNRERARQIIDFHGLKIRNITPTDIDGFIEYQDKAMIFLEFKYLDADLPYGQRLALERLIDNIDKAGKEAVLFVCEHNTTNCDKDVIAENAIVRSFYYKKRWYKPREKSTVKQKINSFISFIAK